MGIFGTETNAGNGKAAVDTQIPPVTTQLLCRDLVSSQWLAAEGQLRSRDALGDAFGKLQSGAAVYTYTHSQ